MTVDLTVRRTGDGSSSHQAVLPDRIERRRAVVGVFGFGHVTLPLLLTFAEHSFPVVGLAERS